MTNNIYVKFSAGETTWRFTVSIEQDKWNWWTLTTLFSVVVGSPRSLVYTQPMSAETGRSVTYLPGGMLTRGPTWSVD